MDIARLKGVSLLAEFDEKAMAILAGVMHERTWDDAAVLVEQGTRIGGAYVLLDGKVKIMRRLPDGTGILLAHVRPGTLFGTLSILDGGARAVRCVASGRVTCAVMERHDFIQLMDGSSPLALRFQMAVLRSLFRDLRNTNKTLTDLVALPEAEVKMRVEEGGIEGLG